MTAEIKRPGQEFTSPSSQLAEATLKYKNEIRKNSLTPETITNYWRALYKSYGPKSEIQISQPSLIGKNAGGQEFQIKTMKLDTEVSRFPGTSEEIKKYAKLGMEPVYVPSQLLGRHGIDFLKNLYSGEINIYGHPKIENKNTKGGWRYAQVDTEVLNTDDIDLNKAQPMDFPTGVTMAAYMNKVYKFLPSVEKRRGEQMPENIREVILKLKNTNTMSTFNGSIIGHQFAEYNNNNKQTAFNFNSRGDMFTTTLEGDTRPLNLVNRLQIPIS